MTTEVAVIIPFFNEESALRHCVESVVGQSYSNIHIVLVDDASTDSSAKIARELIQQHPKRKIELVTHKSNKGLGPARNSGLNHTQAVYIMFLDADDWLVDERSVAIAHHGISHKKSDLAVFNHTLVYDDGNISENPTRDELLKAAEYPSHSNQAKVHILRNHHVAWNKIYTRDILASSGGYPSGSYEDISVTYSCIALAKNISIIEEPLVCYRQRRGTLSTESQIKPNRVKHFDVFKRYDSVFSTIKKLDTDNSVSAEMYSRMLYQFVSTYHAPGRIPKSKRREFFSLTRQYAIKYQKFKGKPSSFVESGIRLLISLNLWRASHGIFRLYSNLKKF